MRESHPADLKGHCPRCYQSYYLCEGCPCDELSDEELEEIEEAKAEAAYDRYLESQEPSDYESDQAQARWEAWITRNW